jgi:hypothetical protein
MGAIEIGPHPVEEPAVILSLALILNLITGIGARPVLTDAVRPPNIKAAAAIVGIKVCLTGIEPPLISWTQQG